MTTSGTGKLLFGAAVVYLAALGYLLFFAPFRENTLTEINLVPFSRIGELTRYTFSTGSDWWHWLINVPGNIVAFIPVGMFIVALRKPAHKGRLFLIAIAIPLFVEILQFALQRGSCDVDDLLLNTCGLLVGFRIALSFKK